MTRRRQAWPALGLAVCLGCGLPSAEAPSGAATQEPPPQRVVVLAPAAAEMLDALGLADRVVAVGDFGPWPASLTDRPSVGGYDSPSVERVIELRGDLLLTAASDAASRAHRRLEALGVDVLALDTSTYGGVFASLEQVGHRFDRAGPASELARRMRERIEAVRLRASGARPRRVLFVVGRDPLYVAGPGSHLDEMIRLVGGTNVAHDALSPYQQVSLEAMLERMPEVIVDTSDNRPGAPRGRIAGDWSRWPFLPAVRDDAVYRVAPGRLVIPGLRLPEMTTLMGQLVHPEIFGAALPEALE